VRMLVTAAPKSAVVLWAGEISPEFAAQAINAGVRGILHKTRSVEAHLECLCRVVEGELWLEKSLSDAILSGRRISLTGRERELMAYLAQGLKNKEMGYLMGITEGTVKVYLSRLFQKVGANDRLALALFALRNMRADGSHTIKPAAQPALKPAPVVYFPSQVHRPAA
jgi:two-component system, NarL family, nitrate/nitrite response regulator NarL